MTREFFNRQFVVLVNAYTIAQKLSDEAQDVYWEMLRDIPEGKFGAGVRKCLATCKFFPTIAELGEASLPTKTNLSDYFVNTKNGPDRVQIPVTWEKQVAELKFNEQRISAPQRMRIPSFTEQRKADQQEQAKMLGVKK